MIIYIITGNKGITLGGFNELYDALLHKKGELDLDLNGAFNLIMNVRFQIP